MIRFHNDYSEGCHERILERLRTINLQQNEGYGVDDYCASAAEKIRMLCKNPDLAVHFLVGGTQTNLTVIAAALKPHQGVIAADCGHIHAHETGAVEATGHKIMTVPSAEGKLSAVQVERLVSEHQASGSREHTVQPKMVYVSNPTELGTLYTLRELEDLAGVCKNYGLYLFLDGARLSYGMAAKGNDVTMEDLARLCDVFYMGGTKCGALFGEAAVIPNPSLQEDFRYLMKQRGAMLAKGWLLGLQFDTLLEDDLYFKLAARADKMADQIRSTLSELGYPLLVDGVTNQIFPILPDAALKELEKDFQFTEQERADETHRAVRFCTSWATTQENVDALCIALRDISDKIQN